MIRDTIVAVTSALTTATFHYYDSRMAEGNVAADKMQLPMLFLERPLKEKNKVFKTGQKQPVANLNIFFLAKSALAKKQSERDSAVALMYAAMTEFVYRITKRPEVEEITYCDTEEIYDEFDANLDGIWLQIGVKLYPLENVCPPIAPI